MTAPVPESIIDLFDLLETLENVIFLESSELKKT